MELYELIDQYGQNNTKLNALKKTCDSLKSDIKTTMSELDTTEFDTGTYTAVLSTVSKESMDDDLLVDFVRNLGLRGVIKKKEYVDMDKLEKAIYTGKLTKEQLVEMGKCKVVSSYQKLTVRKSKKRKEGK